MPQKVADKFRLVSGQAGRSAARKEPELDDEAT
jgi:hypothetical protein